MNIKVNTKEINKVIKSIKKSLDKTKIPNNGEVLVFIRKLKKQ